MPSAHPFFAVGDCDILNYHSGQDALFRIAFLVCLSKKFCSRPPKKGLNLPSSLGVKLNSTTGFDLCFNSSHLELAVQHPSVQLVL